MAEPSDRPRRRLGVVAGDGALPLRVAEALSPDVFVVALEEFADQDFTAFPNARISIGEVGAIIERLREAGCDGVVFAGGVKRPDFSRIKVDALVAGLLQKAAETGRITDDAILRVILEAFEAAGFAIVAAEDAARALDAEAGPVGRLSPDARHAGDIAKAVEIAALVGARDIGQGAVVCDGLVLAVEAQEGTDAMLARVAGLPEPVRGTPAARRGVLAKVAKPGQDRRIDLPTIGVATVEGAAKAGLAGVVVEAGGALIVDREAVAKAADAAGLFVIGVRRP